MASKTQRPKKNWPTLLLISLVTALLSNATYAALPISADQVSDFDALCLSDFADIPDDNPIDDLTYENWRYDKSTGSSPGIISNNNPANEVPATTQLKIKTADGSEFRAVSIDYSAFPPAAPNPTPTYELTLQGYKDGAPIPGYIVAVANIVPPVALTTLSLNWDSVDEIRVAPSSDFIVFDNFSVGAVAPTPPGFSKNFLPTQIQAGQASRLDFIIANTTSVVAVTSLDFTDNLPAGVLVASPPNASTSCIGGTLTAVAGTGTVSYTGGTVPAQLGCAVFVDVTSANSGTYVNTSGDLTSSAGNSGTSTATLTVSPFPATIGGLLTGLVTGDNLVLQNNAGDDLTLTADGAFTFATPVNSGDPYAVTVLTQPTAPSETCTVTNGSGTTPAANVDTVSVTCSLNNYSVGGSVSGIAAGGTVVLQNNGADSRSLSADGSFTFSPQADGTDYAITVSTQPTGQTCTVANGSGTLAGADITTASVTCVDDNFLIGGLLSGLVTGDNLVLQNNAGDDLTLTADGAFKFATPVNFGDPYAVTVLAQPTGPSETCTVSNGSGTTPAANVDNVSVTCSLNNYSVGGSVSGIAARATVVLQNNGADSQALSADRSFTFSPQADGTNYAITVSTQPTDQTCTVTNGSGTLAGSDITNANVTCVDNSPPPPNGGTPKAVPVMPLWLYGLMFTMIAGIGTLGFKRRL